MGVPFSNWAARVLLVASKEQNTPTEASFGLYDEDNGPGSDIGTAATGSHVPCLCGHAELPVASDGRRKAELCLLFCISAQAELCACFSAAIVPVGCVGMNDTSVGPTNKPTFLPRLRTVAGMFPDPYGSRFSNHLMSKPPAAGGAKNARNTIVPDLFALSHPTYDSGARPASRLPSSSSRPSKQTARITASMLKTKQTDARSAPGDGVFNN